MSSFEQRPLFANESFAAAQRDSQAPLGAPLPLAGERITEITLASNAHLSKAILAGMLMELSSNADLRWLCWVAERPLKPLLSKVNSASPLRVLQVVSNKRQNTADDHSSELCRIAARALERGKSHTVAVMLERPLSIEERERLECAALAGNAECLLIQLQG